MLIPVCQETNAHNYLFEISLFEKTIFGTFESPKIERIKKWRNTPQKSFSPDRSCVSVCKQASQKELSHVSLSIISYIEYVSTL